MRRKVAVLALASLAACGGSGGGERPSVEGLAARLGCTGLEVDTEQRELGAREQGRCEFAGDRVTVLTYNSNSARDSANSIAKEFGGIAVLGDRWTVRVDSDAIAAQVRSKLGGTVD